MVNNALALSNGAMEQWQVMTQQAEMLVSSGFLPQSIRTAPQAVAIIMLGAELGIGAWAAINGISVIQGKTTVSPQLMLALINRTGQVEDIKIEGDAKGCTVTIKRRGRSAHSETFTMQDAAAMNLANKPNYKSQPAVMLKWRAVAACCRVTFPDAITGMYTPDEMGADTNEEGEVITSATPHLPTTTDTTTGEITVTTPPAPALSLLKDAQAELVEAETVEDEPASTTAADRAVLGGGSQPRIMGRTDTTPAQIRAAGDALATPPTSDPTFDEMFPKSGANPFNKDLPASNEAPTEQPTLLKSGDDGTRSAEEIGKLCHDFYAWASKSYPKFTHDGLHSILEVDSAKVYFATHSLGDAKTEVMNFAKGLQKATA